MKFVNLTPHEIRLRPADAANSPYPMEGDIVLKPGGLARVSTTPGMHFSTVNGIGLFGRTTFGEVTGLPEPEEGTIFIVSIIVAGRVPNRMDVFAPGTGPNDGAIRYNDGSQKGQIFAVTRLVQA